MVTHPNKDFINQWSNHKGKSYVDIFNEQLHEGVVHYSYCLLKMMVQNKCLANK